MKKFLIYAVLLLVLVNCRKDKETSGSATDTPSDFLKDAYYQKLVIQVIYVSGMKPEAGTINNLIGFLQPRLNKPGGIDITYKEIPATGKSLISVEEIRTVEKNYRTAHSNEKTLAASILFLDAEYNLNSGNSKVLGIAYGFSSMAIFQKTIREYSGGIGQPSRVLVESSVTNHEFGHTLGLVNNGTPLVTNHQDASHGRHCDSKNCLMYYATETSDIISNLIGGSVPGLDQNCLNDLKSFGGK